MTTIYTRFISFQTGMLKKPGKAGLVVLCLLLSTSLVAATPGSTPPAAEIVKTTQGDMISEKAGADSIADEAVASQPGEVNNSGSNKTRADKSLADKPLDDKPTAGKPVANNPTADKPMAGKPMADKPAADRPLADKPLANNPTADKPTADRPLADKPMDNNPTANKPMAERPLADKPLADKPMANQPMADNPVVNKPVVDEPIADRPVVDKTLADKSIADRSLTDKSGAESPGTTADVSDKNATDSNEDVPETTSLPVAEDVDLSEPVIVLPKSVPPAAQATVEPGSAAVHLPAKEIAAKPPLVLLGEEVSPGTAARLSWSPDQHFDGISVPTPVLVVNGTKPGKNLCLTAAIHGDELNGIEIVRRVMYDLVPRELSGAVIGVPIVNLQGFRRNSRYLPDRRDLNRFFPGKVGGSSASRIAHSFFTEVISVCDALVDIHTGSFLRTNLPQLRADMSVPEVAALTEGFGATAVLHSSSTVGTLRRAAVKFGIPTVTLETGEPGRLQEKEIEHGTKGIQTLLTKLEMTRRVRVWGDPEPVYYQSVWVRADDGGLLFTSVKLGQRVRKGQVLGTITDPITNVRTELVSPRKGRVLGMALNQVVLPGFAAFRIGIPSNEKEVVPSADSSSDLVQEQVAPDLPESVPTDVDIEDENS